MKVIEIKNLYKSFDNFSLEDINLEIEEGTIVGLIGKNGAGKTTLINTILNITRLDSGSVKVFGYDNSTDDFVRMKENIGVVLDQVGIYDGFSISEIDKLMGMAFENWDSEYFCDNLKRMDTYSGKLIREFSTGMKKKLSIAMALGHKPDLLLLDEPTANLDPFARNELLDFIYEYTRDEKKTVLISSHILSDLEKICDYIIYISDGRVRLFESKDDLLEKYALVKVDRETYEEIPRSIILFEEAHSYGYELLVFADKLPIGIMKEFVTLDDIVVRLIKGNVI